MRISARKTSAPSLSVTVTGTGSSAAGAEHGQRVEAGDGARPVPAFLRYSTVMPFGNPAVTRWHGGLRHDPGGQLGHVADRDRVHRADMVLHGPSLGMVTSQWPGRSATKVGRTDEKYGAFRQIRRLNSHLPPGQAASLPTEPARRSPWPLLLPAVPTAPGPSLAVFALAERSALVQTLMYPTGPVAPLSAGREP